LVSDLGGPCEIVEPGVCGAVFKHAVPHALRDGILELVNNPAKLEAWREPARTRAATFSYEAAANAFWTMYEDVTKRKI
jgi:glycosyltransferase involved in cell wall biosynthesis